MPRSSRYRGIAAVELSRQSPSSRAALPQPPDLSCVAKRLVLGHVRCIILSTANDSATAATAVAAPWRKFGRTFIIAHLSQRLSPRGEDAMKIHEFQAKEILRKAGVAVPRGVVAGTSEEAAAAFRQLGGKMAGVKAQGHAGGRGKGTIKPNAAQHGVQLVKSAD